MTGLEYNPNDVQPNNKEQFPTAPEQVRILTPARNWVSDAGISAFPDGDNIFQWTGTITGGAGTVRAHARLAQHAANAKQPTWS